MKALFIHSDHIDYKVTKKTPVAEDIPADKKEGRMEEALTVFITIEKADEGKTEQAAKALVENIEDVASKVNTKSIMLYPYAHLSSSLGNPKDSVEILKNAEVLLKEKGYDVSRSPFGWYKAFDLRCKGHPLSELSREITVGEEKVTREDVVEKIESRFLILTPDGTEIPFDPDKEDPDLSGVSNTDSLKKLIKSEIQKGQPSEVPPSIKAMQRLELVDYEPAADSGHFRMYPKGKLISSLLTDWAHRIAVERLHAMQIDTPIMYDWSLPDIHGQGKSFHERHYMIETPDKREFVLRFAADFGLFRMLKTATISYKQLPLRVYEFSKSFRYEKHGELSGLRRLRAFHMPDLHSFTADVEAGWKEYQEIYRHYTDLADGVGIEYSIVFRIVDEFYQKYKDVLVEMLKYSDKPALIEVISEMKHYWAVKHEFQGIDSVGGNCQLSTVQLDVEDAERYGILYTDNEGQRKGCIICHSSIGSIERWIFSMLEDALKKEKPELPFWLSPTQLRIIPVREEYLEGAIKLADSLPGRVDVDDRSDSLGKRIRSAEKEWIPMILVYGQNEMDGAPLKVRHRTGEVEYTLDSLKEKMVADMADYPKAPLAMPKMVSQRIIFRG